MPECIVFISYSHDSAGHRDWVLRLSERLREDGFETRLDRYVNGTPKEGWPRWMLNRLDEATHVLVVCTETYYRRFRGHEVPGLGKGVDWEGALITQEMYDARSSSTKFVPVLRTSGDAPFIPEPLRGATHYVLDSEERYQSLLRFLAGADGIEPGPVGSLKVPPRATAPPLDFPTDDGGHCGGDRTDARTPLASSPPPIQLPVSGVTTSTALEPWQIKLKQRLADQLREPRLDSLVREFVQRLRINDPGLPGDTERIAEYLVSDSRDRYGQVAIFLAAARRQKPGETLTEPMKELFALLLQTLVRQCCNHDNHAVTQVPAELLGTVELFGAARATVPRLPGYSEANSEHQNGSRDRLLRRAGHYLPETGVWDVQEVCLAIARGLLEEFKISPDERASLSDPLKKLRSKLLPFDYDHDNLPFHGIVVQKSEVSNPAQFGPVASRLHEALGELFSVYVYGRGPEAQPGDPLPDWLHTDEEYLSGLVSNFRQDVLPDSGTRPRESNEGLEVSKPHIQLGTVEQGATVNINTGTQTDVQIGQGNIRLAGSDAAHLLDLLGDLRARAQAADDVDKRAYAQISQASEAIEAELTKPEGADKSALARARDILGPFKDVATIAAAIEKITTVLGPLLI